MAYNDFSGESPINYEQKTLCCLVVDTSSSMHDRPINELNNALQAFHQEIANDRTTAERLEIAVVSFNSTVTTAVSPGLVSTFTMPQLTTSGSTKLVDGVREAISLVESRKGYYKATGQPYLRPWIVLITDGAPDAGQDIAGLAHEIRTGVDGKRFVFFATGVQGANMQVLNQISHPQFPPAMLSGLKFLEFFQWLSNSMSIMAGSETGDRVDLPPLDWTQGFTV